MNRWLNFRGIKQSIPIEAVLGYYQWKYLRRRGDQVQGCCPIHRGQRPDAFNVDLRNNGFHCFSPREIRSSSSSSPAVKL